MIKNLLFICLTFFGLYGFAQNFTATYGFADVSNTSGTMDPSISPTVTGLTFGSFSSFGTSSNPSASGRFSFTGWPSGGVNATDDYSNFTGALSPTVYYEVSISVNPGYTLNLNSMTFAVRRTGTGIRNYCVRADLDGYTNNLAASTGTNAKLEVLPGDVFFWSFDSVSTSNDQKGSTVTPGNQFSSITNSVTFRFFAWNAESAGGNFSIDNVSFSGSATNTVTVPNSVGLEKLMNADIKLKWHPNPSFDGKIILDPTEEICRIEVISVTGNKVFTQNSSGELKTTVDLSVLDSGVYFLKTTSENGTYVSKVVLSHK